MFTAGSPPPLHQVHSPPLPPPQHPSGKTGYSAAQEMTPLQSFKDHQASSGELRRQLTPITRKMQNSKKVAVPNFPSLSCCL